MPLDRLIPETFIPGHILGHSSRKALGLLAGQLGKREIVQRRLTLQVSLNPAGQGIHIWC